MASIETMIKWMKDREGKVTYSMSSRLGPNSYDCSSAVYFALQAGGFLPSGTMGNTDTLFNHLEQSNWKKLSLTNGSYAVKRGDIFIWGTRGASGGASGHTGIFVDSADNIIHCNYGYNGITINNHDVIWGYNGKPAVTIYRYNQQTTDPAPIKEEVLVGDFNGNGKDTIAIKRGNEYHIKNTLAGGEADKVFIYGRAEDVPLVGDWNGDGKDTIAIKRGNEYHIKYTLSSASADKVFIYGRADDIPLVGDFNGDGKDTISLRRGNVYHIRNVLAGGTADKEVIYGRVDDEVLVGDFNGDGKSTLAVKRGNEYHIKYTLSSASADKVFTFGRADDIPLVGDWNGDGKDTISLKRGNEYHIKYSLSGGEADHIFIYGKN